MEQKGWNGGREWGRRLARLGVWSGAGDVLIHEADGQIRVLLVSLNTEGCNSGVVKSFDILKM